MAHMAFLWEGSNLVQDTSAQASQGCAGAGDRQVEVSGFRVQGLERRGLGFSGLGGFSV